MNWLHSGQILLNSNCTLTKSPYTSTSPSYQRWYRISYHPAHCASNTVSFSVHAIRTQTPHPRCQKSSCLLPSSYQGSPHLLLCCHGPHKSAAASSQYPGGLLAYQLANRPVPDGLKAHSTRAVSTSTALFKGVQLQNICKAVTWANPLTFARHYRLDVRVRNYAAFRRAMLLSLIL